MNSSKPIVRLSHRSNRGGILVLVALCLAVIIGIVGLAIDMNIGMSARTDQQQVANALATGAIEAYLSDTTLTQPQRLDKALARTLEIAQLPKNQSIFKSFLANPNEQAHLCLLTSLPGSCADTDQGALIPGYWYVDINTPSNPCHGNYPCFVPGDGTSGDLTGFQVELKESNASPLKTMFAKLLGTSNIQTKAVSTAAVVPRQIVISVDVSPSIVGTTHKTGGAVPLNQSRAYAYKLDPRVHCDQATHTYTNPCNVTDPSDPSSPCGGIVHSILEPFDVMWNTTPQSLPGNAHRTSVTEHYKDDYQCWHVDDDGNGPANYLIDTYQNLDPSSGNVIYKGPEPLTTILQSISQALTVIESRRNAGDRVQISFFDTLVYPFREVPYLPDDAHQAFSLARIANDDPLYQEIQRMMQVGNDPAAMGKRITEHALFPRVNPLISTAIRYSDNPPTTKQDQVGGVFSNIALASKRASNALIRSGNIYARRNVVMFSDFIPNCETADSDSWCINDGRLAGDMIFNIWYRIIDTIYLPNKIAFNPILLGDYVRPHTMLPLNGEGTGCLWDQNSIRMNVPGPITDGNVSPWSYINSYGWGCPGPACDEFNADPPNSYYFRPNYFYGAALDSGGEWGIIRPCCVRNGGCADVRPVLDQGCASLDHDLQDQTYESGWGCQRNEAGNHCKAGFTWKRNWIDDPATGHATTYLDEQGRLICDPQGRTEAQQMVDYMTKIMGSNSIILVQPK